MGGRAGGGSSSPDLPEHIREIHEEWLRGNPNVSLPSEKTITALLNNKIGDVSTNPYSNKNAYNPQAEISSVVSKYNELNSGVESLETNIDNVVRDVEDTIKSYLIDSINRDLDGQISSIINESVDHIKNLVGSDLKDSISSFHRANISNISGEAMDKVKDIISTFVTEAIGNLSSTSDIPLSISNAVASNAMNKAMEYADSIVDRVVNATYNVIESSIINDLVSAYNENTKFRYNNAVGKIAASASKAGAAMTSAFTIGKAIMEIERLKDVDEYEAKIKAQILNNAFNIIQTGSASVYQAVVESFKVANADFVEKFRVIFAETVRAYVSYVAASIDSIKADLITTYNQYGQLNTAWLNKYYSLYTARLAEKNRAILTYIDMKMRNEQTVFGLEMEVGKYLESVKRFSYVANREFEMSNLEIDTRERLWDFDVFQKAANVLASASGAVAVSTETIQPQPSAVSTALAVAAAGAAIGGPKGAVIGGALGLGAGLVQALID